VYFKFVGVCTADSPLAPKLLRTDMHQCFLCLGDQLPNGCRSPYAITNAKAQSRHDAKKNLIFPFASLRLGVFAFPFFCPLR
jgi:hypothetical protein